MTQELKDNLTLQLEEAKISGNPEQIQLAMCSSMSALIDCQLKTATRVKEQQDGVAKLKTEIKTEINERFSEAKEESDKFNESIKQNFDALKGEIRSAKDKGSGAVAVIKGIVKIAALGGGSVGIAGLAKALGVL